MSAGPATAVDPAPAPGWAAAVAEVLAQVAARGDVRPLESEGFTMLDAVGIATPARIVCADAPEAAGRAGFLTGERVVMKALSPDLVHKTEAGAVQVVANRADAIAEAGRGMTQRLFARRLAGFMLCEFVPHETGLGHESLLGFRWTREFGAVVTLVPGGLHAEWLAQVLDPDQALAAVAAPFDIPGDIERAVESLGSLGLVTRPQRGRPPVLPIAAYVDAMRRMTTLAATFCPEPLGGFEINPLVVSRGRLVALDARSTPRVSRERAALPRPVSRIGRLLAPRSVAVAGVSSGINPGRILLRNLLRGIPAEAVTVIKPGCATLDGCRCVPSLASLEQPVDLLILAVAAEDAAAMVVETCETHRAESVILIPGGLEESPDAGPRVARVRDALARARTSAWGGPVVDGGNCLGVRSRPGRLDTLFIPAHKFPPGDGPGDPLAILAGSGAFAVATTSRLCGIVPRHLVTVGNQTDLTFGDWLEYLEGDPGTAVFAVYVEGFRPLDGARFLAVARRITRSGRTVILYRAGRTGAGAEAAASHTAAVAGDAPLTRRLAAAAGVLVADTLEDFEDLTRLAVRLAARPPRGLRLGAMSNAGFECVAIADHLGPFARAGFGEATRGRIAATLARARLDRVVGVRNPFDSTPTLGDAGFVEVARAIVEEPEVDAAVIGCVPHTGSIETLPAGPGHDEDLTRAGGLVPGLLELARATAKPWVAVVDAGDRYDPMVAALEAGGVPVFRGADRALRLFGRWCVARLAHASAAAPPVA